MGVASLVLGIISLIIGWIPFIGFIAYITIIIGLILGIIGCVKKPAEGQPNNQKVPAIIGIVIGVIALIVRIVVGVISLGVTTTAIGTALDANAIGESLNSYVSRLEDDDYLNSLFSTNSEDEENKEVDSSTSRESSDKVARGKINETVVLRDAQLTVDSIRTTKGEGFFEADEGEEYLVVTVTIKNVGTKDDLNYNTLYFDILNTDGQKYSASFLSIDNTNRLGSGKLIPGGTVSGDLVFETKEGETGLKLVYEPFILESDAIEISLN